MKKLLFIPLLAITLVLVFITNNTHAVYTKNDTATFRPTYLEVNSDDVTSTYITQVTYFDTTVTFQYTESAFDMIHIDAGDFYGDYLIIPIFKENVLYYNFKYGNGLLAYQFESASDLSYVVIDRVLNQLVVYDSVTPTPLLTITTSNFMGTGIYLELIVQNQVAPSFNVGTLFRTSSDYYAPVNVQVEQAIVAFEYDYTLYHTNLVDLVNELEIDEVREYVIDYPEAIDDDYYLYFDGLNVRMFDITYISIKNNIIRLYQSDKNLRYTLNVSSYTNVSFRYNYNVSLRTPYDDGYVAGYNVGFEAGKEVGILEGIDITSPEAYEKGYLDGNLNGFYANLHVWMPPAIIIVIILGGIVWFATRRKD
ncbi:MAG: hypothetical protein QXN68_02655 [Thermoplasmata archaeon]